MTTFEKVQLVFCDVLQCSDYMIYPEVKIKEDLAITERVAYDIYNYLKKMFKVEATKNEALNLVTVQDVVNLIDKKLNLKNSE